MACISVPMGELQALREEARMAQKWAKEVRRLEEQLFASQAAKNRGAPIAPQSSQTKQVKSAGGVCGGPTLRAVERAEYEQLLQESEQEKTELRSQVERYKNKLVCMHKEAWETRQDTPNYTHDSKTTRTEFLKLHSGAKGFTHSPPVSSHPAVHGKSAELEQSLQREDEARKEWLRAVRSRGDAGNRSISIGGKGGGSSRSIGVQVSVGVQLHNEQDEHDADETLTQYNKDTQHHQDSRDALIATMKQALREQQARVEQVTAQCSSLEAYVNGVNAAKENVENALRESGMKLAATLRERDEAIKDKTRLAQDLRVARLDKKALEQREAELADMRQEVEGLEKENMDLTYQSLEAIWKGNTTATILPPPPPMPLPPTSRPALTSASADISDPTLHSAHLLHEDKKAREESGMPRRGLGADPAHLGGVPVGEGSGSGAGVASGGGAGGSSLHAKSGGGAGSAGSSSRKTLLDETGDESAEAAKERILTAMCAKFASSETALYSWLDKLQPLTPAPGIYIYIYNIYIDVCVCLCVCVCVFVCVCVCVCV